VLKKITYPIPKNGLNISIEALEQRFEYICILDSNSEVNQNQYIQLPKLVAIGAVREFETNSATALNQLQKFYDAKKDNWLFGYLSYDLKNEIEQLQSSNTDKQQVPLLHFFIPKVVIQLSDAITLFYNDDYTLATEAEDIYNLATKKKNTSTAINLPISAITKNKIQAKITKQEYIDSVNKLKAHIHKGDIYEINFCQEFFIENTELNTAAIYEKLNAISQAPFAAYCKFKNHYLMSASPERFIQKRANHLISQPIKGTAKRSLEAIEDEELKYELYNNSKERSENVMIVDLVRNDLSRIAKRGSITVDELFGIYSFKQVHQMISTVSCELKENISFTEIIKRTFPMGSMTGAPKVSAMRLIEQYESTKRGLYSGAVGYVSPEDDFDFNVVIRSILYNKENNYLSFMVGSAITDKANAEQEYEECLLKAKAMFEVLQ
jgi:para-aminobenzoate synthetase component 1